MKEKCICKSILTRKQLFLLMIVPLLIGMMITFTSLAHAEWNKKNDPLLLQSPQKQGWALVEDWDSSSSSMISQEKKLKTAFR